MVHSNKANFEVDLNKTLDFEDCVEESLEWWIWLLDRIMIVR